MGLVPYAVVDCLNFGNPENPEVLWQFGTCIKGMSDVAAKFNAPVISGNVSFYNEMEGVVINPSPATGVVGVGKLDNIRTLPFKNESDKIIMMVLNTTGQFMESNREYLLKSGLMRSTAPLRMF